MKTATDNGLPSEAVSAATLLDGDDILITGGPHTIVGPGEACSTCDDPLELGDTYMFVEQFGRAGVAHDELCSGI